MSLNCVECERVMGPSDPLPGHDGVMIAPILQSLVWRTTASGEWQWVLHPTLATVQRSLCFRCLKSKIPTSKSSQLLLVYASIEAETAYFECEERQKGKWLRLEDDARQTFFAEYKAKNSLIDRKTCLFCGTSLHEPRAVSLLARSFDRVFCRQFKAGVAFGEQNYSITNHLPLGMTQFKLCFDCVASTFPRLCCALSCDLGGQPPQDMQTQPKSEVVLTDSVANKIREELGTEEAERQFRKLGVKIIGPSQN